MKSNAPQKPVSAHTILRALKRRAWWLALPALVIVPGTAYYVSKMPRRFFSRALVGAPPSVLGATFGPPQDLSAVTAQEELRAVKETILARPALEQTIRDYHVDDLTGQQAEDKLDAMKARVQIQVDGPEAFYIGFKGSDPEQARDVSNHLALIFVQRTSTMRDQRVDEQDKVLDDEVESLRRQVAAQEWGLKQYEESVSQDLPERFQTNLKQDEDLRTQIQAKTDQITDAEARRSSITAEMKSLEAQGVLAPVPLEKTPTQIQIDGLRQQLAVLRARYTPDHPEVKRVEKEIADLQAAPQAPAPAVQRPPSAEKMRYIQLQADLSSIEPKIASYKQDRDRLTQQMRQNEVQLESAPAYSTTISQRMRDVATIRNRYEEALAEQQKAQLNHREVKSDQGLAYQILESAALPTQPDSPRSDRILLVALVASLGLGLAGVFLAEYMDSSFESVEQLEASTALPVLSGVPVIPSRQRRRSGKTSGSLRKYWRNRIVMLADPQSVAGQQYGILALKLRRRMGESGGKVLVVTSATGAEGKSVTAVNLALALASCVSGKVLLIDADLRLPQVADRLGISPEKGLGDWLKSSAGEAKDYVVQAADLDVISGGLKPADPVAALSSPRMREILAQLRETYECVVIDSPPVVPVADSHVLAQLGDGVLVVVRAGRTRPELFKRALESLETAKVLGVVLNGLDIAASPYAYAYRYYQQHYLGRS